MPAGSCLHSGQNCPDSCCRNSAGNHLYSGNNYPDNYFPDNYYFRYMTADMHQNAVHSCPDNYQRRIADNHLYPDKSSPGSYCRRIADNRLYPDKSSPDNYYRKSADSHLNPDRSFPGSYYHMIADNHNNPANYLPGSCHRTDPDNYHRIHPDIVAPLDNPPDTRRQSHLKPELPPGNHHQKVRELTALLFQFQPLTQTHIHFQAHQTAPAPLHNAQSLCSPQYSSLRNHRRTDHALLLFQVGLLPQTPVRSLTQARVHPLMFVLPQIPVLPLDRQRVRVPHQIPLRFPLPALHLHRTVQVLHQAPDPAHNPLIERADL